MSMFNGTMSAAYSPVVGLLSPITTATAVNKRRRVRNRRGEAAIGLRKFNAKRQNLSHECQFFLWHSLKFYERIAGKALVLTDSTFPTSTRSNIAGFMQASLYHSL